MWLAVHSQNKPRFEFHSTNFEANGLKEPIIYRCDLLTGETEISHYHGDGFSPIREIIYLPSESNSVVSPEDVFDKVARDWARTNTQTP